MTRKDFDTPCLLLDLDQLDRNISFMQETVKKAGKQLRPHAKTHKCSALAERQVAAGATGICAAKLSEARGLMNKGIENILITGPVAGQVKVQKLAQMAAVSPTLMTAIDHPDTAVALNEALKACGTTMKVLLDLDVGLNRTGVPLDRAMDAARHIMGLEQLSLCGIQAYAGQVQHIASFDDRRKASLDSLKGAARIFNRLKEERPECRIFSASGTGTFDIDLEVEEVTELQVGSYVLMDVEYSGIGWQTANPGVQIFPPAMTLLSTVVSASHDKFVTVDAGLKSLYRDGGIPRVIGNPGLNYNWFGDEYGKISTDKGLPLPVLGDQIELVVSHCDPTVNQFDKYVLVRKGKIEGEWTIDLRGCCR